MKNKQMKLGSIPFLLCMVFIWSVSLRVAHASSGRVFNHLNLKQITSLDGLPSDEVQKVFQDRDGMMWFATRNGLCKYDGYLITTFKSNLYTPDLFTDNNILCLANDSDHNIWIGTQRGLDVLNKETGAIRKGVFSEMENVIISCLLTSRDGLLWIGSDYGLYSYDKETGTLTHYNSEKTDNILSTYPIKSLFQDSEGDIWIGTWSDGLYRYSVLDGIFYKYPKMNSRNSAHCIYEDSQHNIWVGGWDEGVFLLKDAKDMERVSWVNFRHSPNDCSTLSDNIVYDICEDINTNTLWVGTRGGLSILSSASAGKFTNYKPGKSVHYIPSDEINSLHRDNQGNIWIGSIGGGVFMSDTRASQFNMYRFEEDSDIPASAIRAMLVDDDTVWLGIGTYGVAKHDRKTNQYTFFSRIPEFSEITAMPTVYSITQRKQSGEIWLGTYDGGVYA
ncbi:hybrid sensor histidine kinase/response regulator, partial [Bacteroides sp. OttesenSCG-928-F21]|nr:hybrid sensor histidine kinase/response regulator [Bacteroides sp. OttesenSCG-928-F21]